jgi:hypothetical protein
MREGSELDLVVLGNPADRCAVRLDHPLMSTVGTPRTASRRRTRFGASCNRSFEEHDALAWVDAGEAAALRLADPRLLQLIETVLS